MSNVSRRALIAGGVVAAGAAAGAALTAVGRRLGLVPFDGSGLYGPGATLTYAAHRVLGRNAHAREFPRAMISARPFANEIPALTDEFKQHQASGFADWRLVVEGLVDRPRAFSLGELRALESRSQVTEVACEEGWSYIAEWTGTPLARVLAECGVRPTARYVAYFSTDPDWWDSIDIDEAKHPQTLLAWGMNGETLPVPFGGPLRMRVPRQLGYKSVKFVHRLVVAESPEGFGTGSWGAPAGQSYSWYAGI